MSVEAPPRPSAPEEPSETIERGELEALVEALIEEARQRARRRRRRNGAIIVLIVLAGVTLLSLLGRASPTTIDAREARSAPTAPPVRPSGTIALTSLAQGPAHVYLWTPGGVRDSGIRGRAFGWSPDGSRLLVQRGNALYVARVGGDEVLLTRHGNAFEAAWSPDGAQIAFQADRVPGHPLWRRLLVVDADGRGIRLLRGWAYDGGFSTGNVTWSPDGHEVVFAGRTPSERRFWLYRVAADGRSAPRPLRIDAPLTTPTQPSWSPDGSELAFTAMHGDRGGLYVMGADGSGARRVAEGSGPVWSPDGSMLAFRTHGRAEDAGAWTVHADGTRLSRLPANAWAGLSWSPDSRFIAFAGGGGHETDGDVFVAHPDGTGLLRILRGPERRYGLPLWRHGTATTEAG